MCGRELASGSRAPRRSRSRSRGRRAVGRRASASGARSEHSIGDLCVGVDESGRLRMTERETDHADDRRRSCPAEPIAASRERARRRTSIGDCGWPAEALVEELPDRGSSLPSSRARPPTSTARTAGPSDIERKPRCASRVATPWLPGCARAARQSSMIEPALLLSRRAARRGTAWVVATDAARAPAGGNKSPDRCVGEVLRAWRRLDRGLMEAAIDLNLRRQRRRSYIASRSPKRAARSDDDRGSNAHAASGITLDYSA